MYRKIASVFILAIGMFGASAASAGLLTVTVETNAGGFSGSTGTWGLAGPVISAGAWAHGSGFTSQNWNINVADGTYGWGILGTAGGFGSGNVSWSLALNGTTFFGGTQPYRGFATIKDGKIFAVPEPSSLALLALGLLGLGLARRTSKG